MANRLKYFHEVKKRSVNGFNDMEAVVVSSRAANPADA